MSAKRALKFEEKYRLVLHLQRYPKLSDIQIREWIQVQFKTTVSRSTVYRIKSMPIEAFANINLEQKRIRQVKYPQLEHELYSFYQRHDGKSILSDDVLIEKATQIRTTLSLTDDQIRLSAGWLDKFKKRHGIKSFVLHGEGDSVDTGSLHTEQVKLQDVLSEYEPDDIFNFDESALFFRLPPNRTLASIKRKGKKVSKDRITVGLCCNLTGSEKLDPVVIGKSAKPRCFKGENMKQKKIMYYSNKKAWMNTAVFNDWLQHFNLKMHGRKVILLVDNASSHKVLYDYKNVVVHYLPPNMTSAIQPQVKMDFYVNSPYFYTS